MSAHRFVVALGVMSMVAATQAMVPTPSMQQYRRGAADTDANRATAAVERAAAAGGQRQGGGGRGRDSVQVMALTTTAWQDGSVCR